MPVLKFLDRAKESTTTTGSGTLSLGGAVAGFVPISGIGSGNYTYYTIEEGNSYEIGKGTYNSSDNSLSRDEVFSSSNSDDSKIDLAGSATIFITYPATAVPTVSATSSSCSSTQSTGLFHDLSVSTGLQLDSGIDHNYTISICQTGIQTNSIRLTAESGTVPSGIIFANGHQQTGALMIGSITPSCDLDQVPAGFDTLLISTGLSLTPANSSGQATIGLCSDQTVVKFDQLHFGGSAGEAIRIGTGSLTYLGGGAGEFSSAEFPAIAIGFYAGRYSSSGTWGTAVGNYAGYYNADWRRNTLIGQNAGYHGSGVDNTFIGHGAGQYASGTGNIEILATPDPKHILYSILRPDSTIGQDISNKLHIDRIMLGDISSGRLAVGNVTTGTLGTDLMPTANLDVISNTGTQPIFRVQGTEGELISILDNVSTGVVFSVSDVAGLPLIAAYATGDVTLIENGRYVGIATSSPEYQLDVDGTGNFASGILTENISTISGVDLTFNNSVATIDTNGNATFGNLTTTGNLTASGAIKTPLISNADGATITFDLNSSNIHGVTLGGNRILAIANEAAGQKFMLRLLQDGTGSRTVTWFSTIKWAGGSAPTLTTTADKADVFEFLCTGTDTYDGFVVGQNI